MEEDMEEGRRQERCYSMHRLLNQCKALTGGWMKAILYMQDLKYMYGMQGSDL